MENVSCDLTPPPLIKNELTAPCSLVKKKIQNKKKYTDQATLNHLENIISKPTTLLVVSN